MPRNQPNKKKPTLGNNGIPDDHKRLKLSAEESLKILKQREQERVSSGEFIYERSFDANGKVFMKLIKKKP